MSRASTRKALGLVLSAADRREADAIIAEIRQHGGTVERWDRADRTPAISARVVTAIMGQRHTPAGQLEQFYRYGEENRPRGGKVWVRPRAASASGLFQGPHGTILCAQHLPAPEDRRPGEHYSQLTVKQVKAREAKSGERLLCEEWQRH